ncbi:MAG: adenosylcobalamin-dependent ribonucleoside-diphosphate reductase [Elusimicrobia bacterium]|nr:adenosylcobalamin-dependent ribonucleoside-diphosphate reductase [Elusimicrobiota bacterium]
MIKEDRFNPVSMDLLEKRYLKAGETPRDMFMRVAGWVSNAEKKDKDKWKEKFFGMMNGLDFIPNSPCLMNAGTSMPQLAACFVYPVDDDLESIFDTLKLAALTHKFGGGTGFSFSRLRPAGDTVGMTGGTTSGPVSFMEVYDKATEAIRQGGKRRGANMGILRVDHPDIEEFIDAKQEEHKLNNFNISVAVTDEFMKAAKKERDFSLYFPKGNERGRADAKKIFEKICAGAQKNGEPGVIFIDKINRDNPLVSMGEIEATNPCGEMPLLPYEACILGSVNLASHVKDGHIDWDRLKDTIDIAVRFLDDAIDVSDFPVKQIHDIVTGNRKIGLGVMGFASMLIKLGIPYSSPEGIRMGKKVMKFVSRKAHSGSEELAAERGEFPNFYRSALKRKRRNALVTTIAPTGSISIIAGVSSGIEPVFSLVAERRSEEGRLYRIVDRFFTDYCAWNGLDAEELIEKILEKGGISRVDGVPEKVKRLFLSATEIPPKVHVLMQGAFQGYVDNAISKTVNLPEDFSVKGVRDIIMLAYNIGCKGITVYRQHSRQQQVLNIVCECEK